VCSTKATGFTLEIRNTSDSGRSLLMGCRLLLGTHSLERVPTYLQVLGRHLPVKLQRQRWLDICLSREEALLADNSLSIHIGPSADTLRHVTAIDACVCYAKSKDSLGWSRGECQQLQRRFLQRQHKAKSAAVSKAAKAQKPSRASERKAATGSEEFSFF
jgi:hypothetical protein